MHPRHLVFRIFMSITFAKGTTEDISLPLSFVHSSCRRISDSVTVGRMMSTLLIKSDMRSGGSRRSSSPRSDHAFSSAAGSPGEHGVHLVFPSSVWTCLKCVAEITLRTGCINASRTTMEISEPEYLCRVRQSSMSENTQTP
jgi:hypothetical protein